MASGVVLFCMGMTSLVWMAIPALQPASSHADHCLRHTLPHGPFSLQNIQSRRCIGERIASLALSFLPPHRWLPLKRHLPALRFVSAEKVRGCARSVDIVWRNQRVSPPTRPRSPAPAGRCPQVVIGGVTHAACPSSCTSCTRVWRPAWRPTDVLPPEPGQRRRRRNALELHAPNGQHQRRRRRQ